MFATEILGYVPAQLSKGEITRVFYYVLHPQTGKMKRMVVKCNRIKQATIREQYAKAIVHELNIKLAKGWNPFIEQEVGTNYVDLDYACKKYLQEKKREVRPDTYRSYDGHVRIFLEWLEKNKPRSYYCISFSHDDAIAYMDYVFNDRKVSPVRYNGYKQFCIGLWNFFLAKRYVTANVFECIQKKKEAPKTRIDIPQDARTIVREHLEKNNLPFLVYLMLMYNSLMRPKEILQTRAGNYDLKKQVVRIDATVGKNCKERFCTIPDPLVPMLEKVLAGVNPEIYPFSRGWKPGTEILDGRVISKYWSRLRNKLKLPKEMQMYSMRDSGISNAIDDGISLTAVRDHAAHSSLAVTNLYVRGCDPAVHSAFKTQAPEF
jgi:integrase